MDGGFSADHVFPITPVELHQGYIIGKDKIVTIHPGSYGWKKTDAEKLAVFLYDDTEQKVPCLSRSYEKGDCRFIGLNLAPACLAVIQPTPRA